MKPLIKWPGGKSGEIRQFEYLIPDYDRYIEPFAGGAALYFHLKPVEAVLNDQSRELMRFYRMVREQNAAFRRILDLYCRSFGALKEACERQYPQILKLYRLYEAAADQEMDIRELRIQDQLTRRIALAPEDIGELAPDLEEYLRIMQGAAEDKYTRTVVNDRRHPLSAKDLKNNLVTGFTGGFYLYFRTVFNQIALGKLLCSEEYKTANFYFIREYCYGSMFRYNRAGEFNIPYGGISYNKKDLTDKIERMFRPETAALLERTQLCCEDFEHLADRLELTERDFLFLDPPYDTEFSEYEGQDFTKEDHRRLYRLLERTKARFLLVIKNTEYIRSLYGDRFRTLSFENHYTYNMRSRNEREAEHLIITNIPEGTVPWIRENAFWPAERAD